MGSLFSSPKPPTPDPRILESQKKQEALLEKQERRAEQAQKAEIGKTTAAQRSRYASRRTSGGSGMRLLLSPDREDAQLGLKSKLGA